MSYVASIPEEQWANPVEVIPRERIVLQDGTVFRAVKESSPHRCGKCLSRDTDSPTILQGVGRINKNHKFKRCCPVIMEGELKRVLSAKSEYICDVPGDASSRIYWVVEAPLEVQPQSLCQVQPSLF